MRIAVLGTKGMLGHVMAQRLSFQFGVTEINERFAAGVPIPPQLEHVDAIVNCIGVVKQRAAAQPEHMFYTNAVLPHVLNAFCVERGIRLIHFSTDCVFSGRKKTAYTEADVSDAEDLYGITKYFGEISGARALTLRTSIIGRELYNFTGLLEWFLRQEGKTVSGYTKAIFSGVTTDWLADTVSTILCNHDRLCGVYQVASAPISKFDLLVLLRDSYGLNIDIVPDSSIVCNRALCGTSFHTVTGIQTPSWLELARRLRYNQGDLCPKMR